MLEDIIKKQGLQDLQKELATLAEEFRNEREKKFNAFVDSLENLSGIIETHETILKSNVEIKALLQKILEKEYPEFPEMPKTEFPKIQKVEVQNPVYEVALEKPDWWRDASFDTSKLEKRLTENNQFLGEILVALQNLPNIEKEKQSIIAHISGLIGTRRNLGKLMKNKPETPSGTIDNSNKDFYLSRAPFGGFIVLVRGGAQQKKDEDFTLDKNHIVYTTALLEGENHQAIFF